MKFLNEAVRREFHLLPVDVQKEMQDMGEKVSPKGFELNVLMVYENELTISLDPKFKCAPKDDCPL